MAVNTATKAPLGLSFDWLTGYGELLRSLLRRELRARYKGSALGLVWSLLYPLAMMAVYTLVFSVLWKGARNIPHYPLFVLAGLAVWGFFQGAVQLGTASRDQRRPDQGLVPREPSPRRSSPPRPSRGCDSSS